MKRLSFVHQSNANYVAKVWGTFSVVFATYIPRWVVVPMSSIHTNALYPVFIVVILSSGQALLMRNPCSEASLWQVSYPLYCLVAERERKTWAQDIVLHDWACLDPPQQRRTTRPAQKSYHVFPSFGPGDVCAFVASGTGSQAAWETEMQRLGKAIEATGWSQGHGEGLMISMWKRDDDYWEMFKDGDEEDAYLQASITCKKEKRLMTASADFSHACNFCKKTIIGFLVSVPCPAATRCAPLGGLKQMCHWWRGGQLT